jgi:hypothetical protein
MNNLLNTSRIANGIVMLFVDLLEYFTGFIMADDDCE